MENYLTGLKQGEITYQHLVQQLQNQAMQPRHREVLVSILKLQMQPGNILFTIYQFFKIRCMFIN